MGLDHLRIVVISLVSSCSKAKHWLKTRLGSETMPSARLSSKSRKHTCSRKQPQEVPRTDADDATNSLRLSVTVNKAVKLRPRMNLYLKGKFRDGHDDAEVQLLVDSGAEVSMMSTSVARKLQGRHLRSLKKGDVGAIQGDVGAIQAIAGAELEPVIAVATLLISIGQQQFAHEFVVADINVSAILGSDFQGAHGSTICYRTMQFHPSGDRDRSVVMREAPRCSVVRVNQEQDEAEQTKRAVQNKTAAPA
jgi:hypothetical protein